MRDVIGRTILDVSDNVLYKFLGKNNAAIPDSRYDGFLENILYIYQPQVLERSGK